MKKMGSITRLLRRSFRTYWAIFAAMTGLAFLGGMFEGLGIATVIPLFSLVTGQSIQGADTISRLMLDALRAIHFPPTVAALLIFMTLLFILKGFVQFAVRYATAIIGSRFEENMRRTLLARTLRADWPYLMQQKSGHLGSVMLYDIEQGSNILGTLTTIIITCTTFAAYTVIALTISWRVTLLTLAIGGLMFFLFKPVFYRIRMLLSSAANIQKDITHSVTETMTSIKSIKAMAVENPVLSKAYTLFARLRQARVSASLYRQSSLAVIEPVGFIVIAALFLFNYRLTGFSIVSFAVTMYLVQRMFNYVNSLSGQTQALNQQYPYLRATMSWRQSSLAHAEVDHGTKPLTLSKQLAFGDISFAYHDDRPVLSNLSLTIKKGQLIGLVGPSGAGKTTIIDLLLRLIEPQQGHITSDGTDIRHISLADWRRHISYMPQDAVLLNLSIRDNIRFYGSATDADIEEAARAADIHDMIVALPDGYDTSTGEHGLALSGGQRQRILLARALARRPAVLILDEATSSIDAESEHAIQQTIAKLRGQVTVIIITHRLSTTQYLDRLVVLEDGKVREDGTPQELMERNGSYLARILTHQ